MVFYLALFIFKDVFYVCTRCGVYFIKKCTLVKLSSLFFLSLIMCTQMTNTMRDQFLPQEKKLKQSMSSLGFTNVHNAAVMIQNRHDVTL